MKPRHPDDLDAPVVKIERVRRIYTGGKREEAALVGIVGFIGTIWELTDYRAITVANSAAYRKSHTAFYLRFPDCPMHPAWRLELVKPFMERVGADDPEAKAAYGAYSKALVAADNEWHAANPKAIPVHPDSVDWRQSWDALNADADLIWPPRQQFLMAHEDEFRTVPGLWALLKKQLGDFMHEHYAPINCGDKPRRR